MTVNRRWTGTFLAIAASASLILASSGSAHAGENAVACNGKINTYGVCAGEAIFDFTDHVFQGVKYGERVQVNDNARDSHGVQVYVQWDGENPHRKVCNEGATGCYFYFKIPEGERVSIQVCLTEKSEEINPSCGTPRYGRA
ncbi:hypothetical protein PV416_13485 [Streptomyces ipomoeae]|uniref:hypothetical protein n=1 Tax=Streptomyces ipomoeae TaxID=103232 RepID=UPI0011479BE5|nr:hypothetical protein [Streptomyces ipomoeae]MDX2694682.1 hypothetical protein [Streptomyces ipomoeae]MDX2822086.1 hypothetical protein [Streptomyces ipomoeae]MDX2840713.1 hypothetical protein [Streptomyces ipomoeae]MDX2874788.1 hypothetical protein [Streptomyces ipomoeae]TQE40423.1 hypothetical protein Sipo7851_00640 [Streptomyces ipomoeae]